MKSIEHRIRIDLRPRVDLRFRAALEDACVAASLAGADLDTPDAARIVEEDLRSGSYPNAEISLFRSVEEYRNRVSNWVAWRDGRPYKLERSRVIAAERGQVVDPSPSVKDEARPAAWQRT